jgi:hypothetical protein
MIQQINQNGNPINKENEEDDDQTNGRRREEK